MASCAFTMGEGIDQIEESTVSSPWTVQCDVAGQRDVVGDEMVDAGAVAGIVSMHLFDAGALAVGEEIDGADGIETVRLIAGFAEEDGAERAAAIVAERMPDVRCRVIEDRTHRDWVDAQQASFEPTTIGPFTVRAPWHDVAEQDRTVDIVIDPGAAFGHGAHPSTRLAIELMLAAFDQPAFDPAGVVDLGTGTGVIAIIAAKLGHQVRATDTDPAAIEATENNVRANDVATSIELTLADASEQAINPADFVIANVTIDVHRLLAPSYGTADHIVVSGLLCGQVAEMRGLLPDHRAATIRTSGDWAAVAFVRSLLER